MSEKKFNFVPLIGALLLALLYFTALFSRGFISVSEYDFAIKLREFYPELSGTILPRIPAILATLITGALLYLASAKLKLPHAGTASVLYLCFPPVWFAGTSASAAPVLALLTSVAAAGLLVSRKAQKNSSKFAGFALGSIGAVGAAFFAQSGFFSWQGVFMAVLPLLFLIWAIRLEKLNDSGTADTKINRLAIFLAVVFILLLVVLLIPPVCRFLKTEYPDDLSIFPAGTRLYRPALALLAPLLWLYMVKEVKNYAGKIAVIGVAMGFFLLTMPFSLPWNRFSKVMQKEHIAPFESEILANDPIIFADDKSAASICYCLNKTVIRVNRKKETGAVHPDLLKANISNVLAQNTNDVVVVSADGELESFLPERSKIKYTLKNKYNLFLFSGDKK